MFRRHRFAAFVVILIAAAQIGLSCPQLCRNLLGCCLQVCCAEARTACTWLSPRLYGTSPRQYGTI